VFLKLHYTSEPGREFLVNVNTIAGVEINGTEDKGCVLTLTLPEWDGERGCNVPKFECVRERFDDIERRLHNAGLLI
jgi:hypothetical protein